MKVTMQFFKMTPAQSGLVERVIFCDLKALKYPVFSVYFLFQLCEVMLAYFLSHYVINVWGKTVKNPFIPIIIRLTTRLPLS